MQYRKKKKESGETESTILSLADFSSLAELDNVDAVDVYSKDSFDSDTVNTKSENASITREPGKLVLIILKFFIMVSSISILFSIFQLSFV